MDDKPPLKGAWLLSHDPFLTIWDPIVSLELHFKFGVQTDTDKYSAKCMHGR